jgi:hypothetical protein
MMGEVDKRERNGGLFLSKNFQRKRCLEDLGLEIKIILKWFMQTRDVNSGLVLFPLGWSSKRI